MQNINFKITKQDIIEYLVNHKDDEMIKNREAMFVKYMKESNAITKETLEILMKKYNWDNRKMEVTYSIYDSRGYSKQEELSTFTDYLLNIRNLDVSGICHIMIPMLTYYNPNIKYHILAKLNGLIKEIEFKSNEDTRYVRNDTLENYIIAYKMENVNIMDAYSCLSLSKDKSRKLIERYSHIYGEEPVKRIRKIVKERMM